MRNHATQAFFCVLWLGLAISSFFPHTLLWGFDYYVLKLPFPQVSVLWVFASLLLSIYPFFFLRNRWLDGGYTLLAGAVVAFLGYKIYLTSLLIAGGYDPWIMLQKQEGITAHPISLLFYPTFRLLLLVLMVFYLLRGCAYLIGSYIINRRPQSGTDPK